MSPQEFKKVWNESDGPLDPISRDRCARFHLAESTFNFLTNAGLPKFAPPHLQFAVDSDDLVYGIVKLTEQFDFAAESEDFEKYVVIGSCRDGDVIAVDTSDQDKIVQLDHEDRFRETFFNSSIEAMASFLVIYRDFETSVIAEHGDKGFRFGYFTDIQFNVLQNNMMEVDRRALEEAGFWKDELEIILTLRQEYMDGKDPYL